MRQLVVLLVSVTTVVGGIPLRASSPDDVNSGSRHYILRANSEDADAIASRHGLVIERRDESGSPVYYVGSTKDPDVLKAEVATDAEVVAFEEDRTVSVPEADPAPAPPATDPAATTAPATDPAATTPPATDPAATTPPATNPAATTPPATDPAATTPPATDPAATTPPATDPAATTPPATDPAATTPPATDPAATTPPPTDPTASTPPPTDPAQQPTQPTLDTSRDVPPAVIPPASTAPALPDATPIDFFGTNVWRGFQFQPAATIIRNDDSHRDFATGAGVIAVIDSGVDLNHPALAGTFVEGYDFLAESTNITSDTASLQQSTAVILEYAGDPSMDPLTIAQLNQSTAVI